MVIENSIVEKKRVLEDGSLNLSPTGFGERWFQFMVNRSKNKSVCYILLVLSIVLALSVIYVNGFFAPRPYYFLSLGLLITGLYGVERYWGYKILKRHVDEIIFLKSRITNQNIAIIDQQQDSKG